MASMIIVMISLSVASGNRISEVLLEESDIKNPENAVTDVADGSISFFFLLVILNTSDILFIFVFI